MTPGPLPPSQLAVTNGRCWRGAGAHTGIQCVLPAASPTSDCSCINARTVCRAVRTLAARSGTFFHLPLIRLYKVHILSLSTVSARSAQQMTGRTRVI